MSFNVARLPSTQRLSDVDSAAAYMSDLWGMNIKRKPDGTWETTPDPNVWGIKPEPIIQTAESLMDEAAYHGWRA